MPDGSAVALAPSAKLDFERIDGQRVASLSGEARFDIAHDAAHPFLVHVGDTRVRVVGTRFTLAQHGACTQLSVLSGTVDIRAPSISPRRLNAGEEAVTVAGVSPIAIASSPAQAPYRCAGAISTCRSRPSSRMPRASTRGGS